MNWSRIIKTSVFVITLCGLLAISIPGLTQEIKVKDLKPALDPKPESEPKSLSTLDLTIPPPKPPSRSTFVDRLKDAPVGFQKIGEEKKRPEDRGPAPGLKITLPTSLPNK